MSDELIKKRTRNALREYLVDFYVLRTIHDLFDSVLIDIDYDFVPNVSGERRTLIEQYYSTLDFTAWDDVEKLVRVFESVILESIERSDDDLSKIIRYLENDGFKFENNKLLPETKHLTAFQLASKL
ncbi:MAG: hypothetical protein AAFQ07_20305 [Chloroflexota bacterium]